MKLQHPVDLIVVNFAYNPSVKMHPNAFVIIIGHSVALDIIRCKIIVKCFIFCVLSSFSNDRYAQKIENS